MTGKAVARARKDAAGRRTKTMPRAAVRTGKKRAMDTPVRVLRPNADAERERDARLAAMKEAAAVRAEDDEEGDAHHDEW
jgi:hypothetical protein